METLRLFACPAKHIPNFAPDENLERILASLLEQLGGKDAT